MKILVLNSGSSSLKYQVIDTETGEMLVKGNYERIGQDNAFLTHKVHGEKHKFEHPAINHEKAIEFVMGRLQSDSYGIFKSLDELDAIGHRVVHGGEKFKDATLVTDKVIQGIKDTSELAPLHNPAAILGIEACKKIVPDKPMVVVFDTAFHQTISADKYLYAIPREYYEKYGVRKYGAHGTSHQYVSKIAAELEGKPIEDLKIVTCHLGQGASITAVDGGKSIDTSMGLSPLGGIPMVTRSGDLDPSIVTDIMEKENLTAKEVNTLLNKKSGLYGITGLEPDFRQIELASYEEDKPKAHIAIELFTKSIAQFVAKYAVSMGGLDVVVFTGGIGENQINIRKKICNYLKFMGLEIDEEVNNVRGEEILITKPESKIKAYIIPTNEELVIARDTKALVENK